MRPLLLLLAATACGNGSSGTVTGPCKDLCTALVEDCGYAAYPSFDSCAQGCLYTGDEGADLTGEATCVQDAACDTFAILECQNAYGN